MEELNILRILNKYNPWWSNKDIPPSKINEFKRGDFYVIKKLLEKREIISIIGPRRVGKTIMMHQLIKDLLSSGVDAKRILYLSVDEIELKNVDTQFSEILEEEHKHPSKTVFYHTTESINSFLYDTFFISFANTGADLIATTVANPPAISITATLITKYSLLNISRSSAMATMLPFLALSMVYRAITLITIMIVFIAPITTR